MLSKLEEKLEQYAAKKPITGDRELYAAIEEIMDVQFALPPEQRDPALIREGTEALMALRGVDPRSLNSRASAVTKRRAVSSGAKRTAPKSRFRRLLPPAAVALALVIAVTALVFALGRKPRADSETTYLPADTDERHEVVPSVLPASKDNVVREYGTFAELAAAEDLPPIMTCGRFSDPDRVESVTYIDYGDREQVLVKMREDKFDVLTVTVPSQGPLEGEIVRIGERDATLTVDENGCTIEWISDGNRYTVRSESEEDAAAVAGELATAG